MKATPTQQRNHERKMVSSAIKLLKKNKHQLEFLHQFGTPKESIALMKKIVRAHFPSITPTWREVIVQKFINKHFSI